MLIVFYIHNRVSASRKPREAGLAPRLPDEVAEAGQVHQPARGHQLVSGRAALIPSAACRNTTARPLQWAGHFTDTISSDPLAVPSRPELPTSFNTGKH